VHYKETGVLSRFFRALLSPKNNSKQFEAFFWSRFKNGSTLKAWINPVFHKTVQTWAALIKTAQTGLSRFTQKRLKLFEPLL
jgi:hypothetical protein